MHVLIIPSEDYLPPSSHMEGIFQHHQAKALQQAGCKVGVLAVGLAHSVPMIVKAAVMKAAGRRAGNDLDDMQVRDMVRLLWAKCVQAPSLIAVETRPEALVVRAEGFYVVRPRSPIKEWAWMRAGLKAYERYCRLAGVPDIIHAHNTELAGLLAERITRTTGVPYVITEHSTHYQRGLVPRVLHARLRTAIRHAAGFLVVSPGLGQQVMKVLGECAGGHLWVPNVVEPALLDAPVPAGNERSQRSEQVVFLALGNLIPSKNHALLLRAFRTYIAAGGTGQLRLGGKGPLETELKRQSAELGIARHVVFLGECAREEVVAELDKCDALVLPSLHETFGVVAIEAMARGRPVIATRCGGPEYFITAQDGVLVENDDEAGLAEALIAHADRQHAYSPPDIRKRAVKRFGASALTDVLLREYTRAIAKRGKRPAAREGRPGYSIMKRSDIANTQVDTRPQGTE